MVQWRGFSQEGIGKLRKELRDTMEEEVLEKHKVDEANKRAYREGGEPLDWWIVMKQKRSQPRKW